MNTKDPKIVNLGYLIGRIHQCIRKNTTTKALELNFPYRFEHMIIMRVIDKHGGEMSQSQLLDFLPAFDRHRLSRACVEIEDLGLIRREPNPNNRRENILFSTELGTSTISEFKQIVLSANPQIFNNIRPEDLDHMFQTLHQIHDNLSGEHNTLNT
ncbi:MAG: hypothetical protein EP346_02445 [Bacteroidetes bacterium]|uniref:HTH marR-type domain-containing protein n=1 Tax=Phaeocystidibacter marisrubri TaxID=1577780 RepID=A0A6L3ZFU9_9FLAO|nr:MarR family transcriptional regulator [Phaeocystidibacter marisrubri]KAB2816630.1 hypothetical protein F8C82_13195 [Phaeocystidibacter marisrubri]TNE30919.1 MAG: hypothetical protein EP346_02445 [Bacteroidota bacterium]GGH70034.1 hypothetical protein GCM10011318_11680 [Phaeocystidibacter marisrubri]